MKRWGVGLAVVGAAGLVLSGVLPADAAVGSSAKYVAVSTASTASTAQSSPAFARRYFVCYPDYGCSASAVLPKTWRAIRLGTFEYRFADRTAPRMIRVRVNLRGLSTVAAAKHKQAALKGTRGLKILSRTTTTTMKSTNGQGPLTVTTLVYTYRSGSTTRWVATRYVAQWGMSEANVELTVGGRSKDRAVLTKVLDKATTTIALAG